MAAVNKFSVKFVYLVFLLVLCERRKHPTKIVESLTVSVEFSIGMDLSRYAVEAFSKKQMTTAIL